MGEEIEADAWSLISRNMASQYHWSGGRQTEIVEFGVGDGRFSNSFIRSMARLR